MFCYYRWGMRAYGVDCAAGEAAIPQAKLAIGRFDFAEIATGLTTMTDHRLREILRSLQAEKLRIEELILDFQMFASESTLHNSRAEDETSKSPKRPSRRGRPVRPS